MALVDIPGLTERIRSILPMYTSKSEPVTLSDAAETQYRMMEPILEPIIMNMKASDPTYWKKAGIRWMDPLVFNSCLETLKSNTKELGSGYYGTVYDVPVRACTSEISNKIPSGLRRVGVKVERLKERAASQTPEYIQTVFGIAKKASQLGIGPACYDLFVTLGADGFVRIVKLFEIIQGTSWDATVWKSPAKKLKALAQLDKHIHTMNKAGIIHQDLHGGNVMVTPSGRVYIIDYDLASYSKDAEAGRLDSFNDYILMNKDVERTNRIKYVFQALQEEGALRLTAPETAAVTRKSSVKKSSKTRRHVQ